MPFSRRTFLAGSAAVALATPATGQGAFPNKPIRMVVPYAPGGATDFSARIVAEGMNKKLGQPVVIENRPGASQMIGMEYTARAAPDGYTLIFGSEDATALAPFLRNAMPYQMPDAFTYICRATVGAYMICINPNRPYKTVQEFIAYAKSNPPNTVKYATAGPGTAGDIAAYLIEEALGIKMLHVAYKGGAPSLVDTLGGVTDMVCQSYSGVAEHAKAGRIRLMLCTGPERNALEPNVPTLVDLGHKSAVLTNWLGVLGPAGIPKDIQEVLQKTVADVLREPEVKQKFLNVAFDPTPVVGEDFKKEVVAQMVKWKAFAEKTGIKMSDE
jgi:tripartite-type tricarboxylate transporter receptor subunit TctC